ncbi:MAG: non-canonical purine NTP pyrophosphatase [Caldilineaceae bacterium]
MELLLATGNQHKAQQIQAVLGRSVQPIKLELPEVQAIDVHAVIEQKAKEAYRQLGKPVLVEDTSLAIHAWNGLPGALIRWFLETVGNEGICEMLAAFEHLEATAETCIGYFDGDAFRAFSGAVEGRIARSPHGSGGFGWDPIFIPNGWDKTFAEMTQEEGNTVSMRKVAILKLQAFLDERSL